MLWILTGRHFQFTVDWYSIGGNLFSNFYEEVEYRALLLPASIYLFRSKWAAFFVSALIMGLTHSDYPLFLQSGVAVASFIMAIVYYKTGNLLAPWLTHQVSDMILDAILAL
jgi:membrane protease YdiL (CAAX protease family)